MGVAERSKLNRRAFIKGAAMAAAATALPGRALRSEITHYADFTNYPDVAVVSDDALVESFLPMPVIPASVWAELAARYKFPPCVRD